MRKEFQVGDYMIPEGAMLMYNTYSLHMDPAHWKDPENFRPDRWHRRVLNDLLKEDQAFLLSNDSLAESILGILKRLQIRTLILFATVKDWFTKPSLNENFYLQ